MKILTNILRINLVFLVYFTPYVRASLTCLSCKDSPIPRDCQYTTVCGPHEVCFTNAYVTSVGSLRHELGCMDINKCAGTLQARSASNLLVCTECCNGTLCNSGLCGQTAIAPLSSGSRGPICYSCDQQLFPDTCHVIKECSRDEECILERFTSQVGHDLIYKSDCVKKSICAEKLHRYQSGGNAGNIVGKRTISNPDGRDHCAVKCCGTDLCNSDCTGPRVVQMANVTMSTVIPVTPVPTINVPTKFSPSTSTAISVTPVPTTNVPTTLSPSTSTAIPVTPAPTTNVPTTYPPVPTTFPPAARTTTQQVTSTGECKDAHIACYNYHDYCSMTWGLQNCRKTCNLCHVPLTDPCIDHTLCAQSLHLCNTDWAILQCVRSCNRCSELPHQHTATQSTSGSGKCGKPDFWPARDCERNKQYCNDPNTYVKDACIHYCGHC